MAASAKLGRRTRFFPPLISKASMREIELCMLTESTFNRVRSVTVVCLCCRVDVAAEPEESVRRRMPQSCATVQQLIWS